MDAQTPIENHLRDIAVVDLYGFLSVFDENLTRRVVKYQRGGRFNLFSIVCIESNSNVIQDYTLGCCRFREEQYGVQGSKSNHDGFGHVLVLEWYWYSSLLSHRDVTRRNTLNVGPTHVGPAAFSGIGCK